jgi:hypothetical protein
MSESYKNVPTADVARVLGVNVRTLSRLVKRGIMSREPDGSFNLPRCVKAYIAHREGLVTAQMGNSDYARWRTSWMKQRALKAKKEREILEGEWLPLTGVHRAWATLVTTFKIRVLNIPSKTAPLLVGLKTPDEAGEILTREVREALEELKASTEDTVRAFRGP